MLLGVLHDRAWGCCLPRPELVARLAIHNQSPNERDGIDHQTEAHNDDLNRAQDGERANARSKKGHEGRSYDIDEECPQRYIDPGLSLPLTTRVGSAIEPSMTALAAMPGASLTRKICPNSK